MREVARTAHVSPTMRALLPLVAASLFGCHALTSSSTDAGAAAVTPVSVNPIATATAAPATSGKTYVIHLGRKRHAGESMRLVADDERDERTSAQLEGVATSKDSRKAIHVHLDGTDVLDALQPDGHSALRDTVTVNEFWETKDGGAQQSLARAGARLVLARAAKKEDATVTIDGRVGSKIVRDAVDALTSLKTNTGPSDDAIFGTKTPQAVGAEWPANTALAESDLATRGIVVAPGSLTGGSKLVSVSSEDGGDYLDIESHVHVGALKSISELPPGSTVEDATIDVVFHTSLPVDESRIEPKSDMRVAMKGTFKVPSPKGVVRVALDTVDFKHVAMK